MKRFLSTAMLLSLLTLPVVVFATGDDAHREVNLQGEVLDLACYVAHGASGEDHVECAKMCVKNGQPMGLLASDGTAYLLYAGHDDATAYEETKTFAGKKVDIRGKEATRGGIKGIEVRVVKVN